MYFNGWIVNIDDTVYPSRAPALLAVRGGELKLREERFARERRPPATPARPPFRILCAAAPFGLFHKRLLDGILNLLPLAICQFHLNGPDILFEMLHRSRSRDRQDLWRPSQQPRE